MMNEADKSRPPVASHYVPE